MRFTPNDRNSSLQLVATAYGHTAPCTKLDFSFSNGLMCTVGMDHLLAFWDFQELVCLKTWQAEMKIETNNKNSSSGSGNNDVAEIKDIKVSPCGNFVGISAAEEITLIDIERGASIRKSFSPNYRSYSISFHPKYPNLLALGGEAMNTPKSNGILRLVDSS